MNKGMAFEKEFSQHFHKINTALLISAKHLRKNHLGQVDMAKVVINQNNEIKSVLILELKYQSNPCRQQLLRLMKTSDYLSQLLNVETKFTIKLCKNPIDSLFY